MSIDQVFAWSSKLEARDAKIDTTQITLIDMTQITERGRYNSNLKISGSYLIEELTETKSDAGSLAKTAYGRCYYFIPDLNR